MLLKLLKHVKKVPIKIVEKAVQEAENTTREQLATAREQIEQEKIVLAKILQSNAIEL